MTRPLCSISSPRSTSASSRSRSAVATIDHNGHEITLVDTPGYADFAGEVVEGFEAVDAAIFTMDASGGVEAGTERAIRLGRAHGTAGIFVITRCERENADPTAALDALRAAFGNKIAPLHLAIGKADSFQGYVDLVHRKAYVWQGGKKAETEIPAELNDEVARRRDQLLEAAAEADDDVLTKYLEGEEISDEELEGCLHRGVRDSILAPVMVVSAQRDIGIDGLLDAIVRYFPSPDEEKPVKAIDGAGKEVDVAQDADRSAARARLQDDGRPVRRSADLLPRVQRQDRLARPRLERRPRRRGAHRPGPARQGQGHGAGGRHLRGRDRRGREARQHAHRRRPVRRARSRSRWPPIDFPPPTLPVAIEPQTKADLDKMGAALARLLEEDPSVTVERQTETGEQLLWAQGESHVAVIVERLKRKFGAAVVTHSPRIPYRETIRSKTQAEGRHKKQIRRPRPVRPRVDGDRAKPGQRRRVRDARRGWLGAAPVLVGHRKGRS